MKNIFPKILILLFLFSLQVVAQNENGNGSVSQNITLDWESEKNYLCATTSTPDNAISAYEVVRSLNGVETSGIYDMNGTELIGAVAVDDVYCNPHYNDTLPFIHVVTVSGADTLFINYQESCQVATEDDTDYSSGDVLSYYYSHLGDTFLDTIVINEETGQTVYDSKTGIGSLPPYVDVTPCESYEAPCKVSNINEHIRLDNGNPTVTFPAESIHSISILVISGTATISEGGVNYGDYLPSYSRNRVAPVCQFWANEFVITADPNAIVEISTNK